MNTLDVLCAQLTRDLFAIAKFLLTIDRLLLHCWYSIGRTVMVGTPMVIFAVLSVFRLFLVHCWFQRNTYGRRAFAVAAPATWNTLSDELRNPDLHSATFRRNLKTFLFRQYLVH